MYNFIKKGINKEGNYEGGKGAVYVPRKAANQVRAVFQITMPKPLKQAVTLQKITAKNKAS